MNPEKYGFGVALDYLKSGRRIAREGWNGKGMWLMLVPQDSWDLTDVCHMQSGEHVAFLERLPWIGMRTADGKFVPWLASQTDILASDWVVL